MNRRLLALLLAALLVALIGAPSAGAGTGPVYTVEALWGDTNLPPGGHGFFEIQARNVGDAAGSGVLKITDQLPAGVTIDTIEWTFGSSVDLTLYCSGLHTEKLSCTLPSPAVPPSSRSPTCR